MRLPPGPGRCRQRAAADAARFPESFRARRALLETYPDPARLREPPSADRDVPPPARDTCGAWPGVSPYRPPPPTGHSAPPRRPEVPFHSGRTFRPAQTGGSVPCRPHNSASRKLNTPPAVGRRCSARQATLYAGAGTKKPGRQPTLYAEAGTKKTGRQPTLGPARGTGYRDASSCRRPAICGKISAQITRRTGTARQPGQPVVQI